MPLVCSPVPLVRFPLRPVPGFAETPTVYIVLASTSFPCCLLTGCLWLGYRLLLLNGGFHLQAEIVKVVHELIQFILGLLGFVSLAFGNAHAHTHGLPACVDQLPVPFSDS